MQLVDATGDTWDVKDVQWYGMNAARAVSFILENDQEIIIRLSADDRKHIEDTFRFFYDD